MIIDPLRKSQHPRLEAPHQPDTHTAWNSRPTKCHLLSKGVLTTLIPRVQLLVSHERIRRWLCRLGILEQLRISQTNRLDS